MAIESFNHYQKYFELAEADGYPIHLVELGKLALPTGKIIASDPFQSFHQLPFSRTVPAGNYPVTLAIAEVEEKSYRVGLARIKFAEQKALSWELAVTNDVRPDELAMLGPNEFIGYEANAGLGMFTDAKTNENYIEVLQRHYQQNENANYYQDILAKEFTAYSGSSPFSQKEGDWNVHCPTGDTTQNIMMFASGWGSGLFPSYWGFDESRNIVELVTDFFVFGEFE